MSENNNTQKPIETLKKLEQNLESAVSVLKEKHSYFEVVLTFDENGKRQVFFDDIDGIIIKGVDEQICDETLKQFNIVKIVDELLKVIKIDHDDSIVLTPKGVYLNFSHINAEKELTQSRVNSIQKLFEALSQFQQMLKND